MFSSNALALPHPMLRRFLSDSFMCSRFSIQIQTPRNHKERGGYVCVPWRTRNLPSLIYAKSMGIFAIVLGSR